MPDNFMVHMAIYATWGLIAFIAMFWKPGIWPAIKRGAKMIHGKAVAYLKYCEDGHSRKP